MSAELESLLPGITSQFVTPIFIDISNNVLSAEVSSAAERRIIFKAGNIILSSLTIIAYNGNLVKMIFGSSSNITFDTKFRVSTEDYDKLIHSQDSNFYSIAKTGYILPNLSSLLNKKYIAIINSGMRRFTGYNSNFDVELVTDSRHYAPLIHIYNKEEELGIYILIENDDWVHLDATISDKQFLYPASYHEFMEIVNYNGPDRLQKLIAYTANIFSYYSAI